MTSNKNQTTYDEVPYKSHPFAQTHPDRLATLGHLFGLKSAPVNRCKVLELGCAGGGNIIPMAFYLPDSKFIGVDLSMRHVETANQTINALNLKNISIDHASILDIADTWGLFDYIICHGVYSWTAPDVQNKILEISSRNLSPNGIAYVSYNTYPGWHLREMIRHMMRYHSEQFNDTGKRIEQARALIDFLSDSVSTDNYYGQMLKSELNLIQQSYDWYLFHDHLEEINTPVYFHQFVERAEKHNLQYLGEADFSTMLTSGFSNEIADTLNRISPNILRIEQYMDFLRNRFFRQTLLCHKNHILKRNLDTESLKNLKISATTKFKPDSIDYTPDVKQSFQTKTGQKIITDLPLTKATLTVLYEYWPMAVDQETVFNEAIQKLGSISIDEKKLNVWNIVLEDILYCYSLNKIELHTWQAKIMNKVSITPKINKLTKYQVTHNHPTVNSRHEIINLDVIAKELIPILDGNQNHSMLFEHLRNRVTDGAIVIRKNETLVTDNDLLEEILRETLESTLRNLADASLLIA